MPKLRVSIDSDFADYLIDLHRHTWEASEADMTPEHEAMYSHFCESVRKATRLTKRAADLRRARAKVASIQSGARR